jgi:anti-anti-sigma factor
VGAVQDATFRVVIVGPGVIGVHGQIDAACSDEFVVALTHAINSQPTAMVVVDCTEVRFIDSSGMRALFQVDRKAATAGHTMRLLVSPPLRRVLEIAGMKDILDMEP